MKSETGSEKPGWDRDLNEKQIAGEELFGLQKFWSLFVQAVWRAEAGMYESAIVP